MNKVSITKVFKYRCFEPVEGLALFDEALDNRHTLWNKLVEIDRNFREKALKLLRLFKAIIKFLIKKLKIYKILLKLLSVKLDQLQRKKHVTFRIQLKN